jgi:hypothetical protein
MDALEQWGKSGPSAPCTIIGEVCEDALYIAGWPRLPVTDLARAWCKGLDKFF